MINIARRTNFVSIVLNTIIFRITARLIMTLGSFIFVRVAGFGRNKNFFERGYFFLSHELSFAMIEVPNLNDEREN